MVGPVPSYVAVMENCCAHCSKFGMSCSHPIGAVWGICGVSVGVVVLMVRLNASCTVDPVPSAMPKC